MAEALLVVDVQQRFNWSDGPDEYEPIKRRIALNMIKVIDLFRRNGEPVIFIMFPSFNLGTTHQLSMNTAIKDEPPSCLACDYKKVDYLPSFLGHQHDPFEPVFFKDSSDAFRSKDLVDYLKNSGIDSVLLIGCYTWECVMETAVGAVRNNFKVNAVRDCIYPNFCGELEVANWVSNAKSRFPSRKKYDIPIDVVEF